MAFGGATTAAPSWSLSVLIKSGRSVVALGPPAPFSVPEPAEGPTDGAALTFTEDPAVGFFRLSAAGTKAVASFLKSRNSGSAEITADADVGPVGARGLAGAAAVGMGGRDG